MSVHDYINRFVPDCFRVIVFVNWKSAVIYDSTKTALDIPQYIADSIIENVYETGNGVDIEI